MSSLKTPSSIEDLSRFATSTASSSRTSLDLLADQEMDMSVSGPCPPMQITVRLHAKPLTELVRSLLHTMLLINLTSSLSEPVSLAVGSPTPYRIPVTVFSSLRETSHPLTVLLGNCCSQVE